MERKMLLAKINPPLSRANQTDQFQQTVSWTIAEYMVAKADPYILGSNFVDFDVSFGEGTINEENKITEFRSLHRDRVRLSGTNIENWGQDDTTIFAAIASHFSINIVSTHESSLNLIGDIF